jgi:hypothetical protein
MWTLIVLTVAGIPVIVSEIISGSLVGTYIITAVQGLGQLFALALLFTRGARAWLSQASENSALTRIFDETDGSVAQVQTDKPERGVWKSLVHFLYPPIRSIDDARRMARRCWGGWFIAALLMLNVLGSLVQIMVKPYSPSLRTTITGTVVLTPLAALSPLWAYWLSTKAGFGSAWALFIMSLLLAASTFFTSAVHGDAVGVALFVVASLAALSLWNAIRGCGAIDRFSVSEAATTSLRSEKPPSARPQ